MAFDPIEVQRARVLETASEETEHSAECHLSAGNDWRECLCDQIDPVDCPCVICDAMMMGAIDCTACLAEYAGRLVSKGDGNDQGLSVRPVGPC